MWPIERMQRQAPGSVPEAEPFALVEKGAHGLRISAVSVVAAAAGVAVGAALPDVRAALPSLVVRPAEATRDRDALLALAGWLTRYGPASNVDGPDGVWVDVSGVPHLFGGETQLCADLATRLGRLGFTARIGFADTLGAAHALARFASPPPTRPWAIAPAGAAGTALAPLPVAALRLAPEATRLLVRLGLKRVGQLYGLPRSALAARFREVRQKGARQAADIAAAMLLLRLDQALGVAREPRSPLVPPPEALSRLAFADPLLTAEGVERALDQLAGMLTVKLADQGLGARRFRLALHRADGTVAEAVVGTSVPGRDPLHVRRLMAERLSALDAGFGIDVATLEAGRLAPLGARQIGLEATAEADNGDATALVDRLVSRLGVAHVRIWSPGASHIPERAELWRVAIDTQGEAVTHASPPPPRVSARRPPLLLSPPEPISVIAEIPEGAPQHFVWRRLARRIVKSEGPERIAPEWWRHIRSTGRSPGTRDYYRLEDTTGARYWVFREGLYSGEGDLPEPESETGDGCPDERDDAPRWFVHGVFG